MTTNQLESMWCGTWVSQRLQHRIVTGVWHASVSISVSKSLLPLTDEQPLYIVSAESESLSCALECEQLTCEITRITRAHPATWQPADWAAARERPRRWCRRNRGKREWEREKYPFWEGPRETLERWNREDLQEAGQ